MPKKTKITPEMLATFHEAVADTKPLKQKKIRLADTSQNHRSVFPKASQFEPLTLSETAEVDPVSSETFISYKQLCVSHKILRKLRKGQYNVEAILDLHGMTVEKARTAVAGFLKTCLLKEIRVALIIHGKGHHSQMPILKNKLNLWLRDNLQVLAFCSAVPLHGSRGAIYVLLKQTVHD